MNKKYLIKDEKIRLSLKTWAKTNDIHRVVCYIGDYDHGGFCLYDGIIEFRGIEFRIGIQFERKIGVQHLENKKIYYINELVGEE